LEKEKFNARMHTFIMKCRKGKSKGNVVFLHGFGGSCATYYPFIQELSEHFDTYAFDWLGMGCSSKPNLEYIKMNARQVIDLYVDSLRKWILEMNLGPFHFVCHSLGAYFATHYLSKYNDGVVSFSSISCAGMTQEPDDFLEVMKTKKLPFKRKAMKWFWNFMNKGFIRGHTAFSAMPLEWIINKWTNGRNNFVGDEKLACSKFIASMFWDRHFSGDIVTRLFGYRAYSPYPVTDVIEEVERKVPVMHIYGDLDWMDKHTFNKFIKQSRIVINSDGMKSLVVVMMDTGHQIPNLKPKELLEHVLTFIEDKSTQTKTK